MNAKNVGIWLSRRNRVGSVVDLKHRSGFNVFENMKDLF
jgi:hypothetical protein